MSAPKRYRRNYKAMNPGKLMRVIAELSTGGEAYTRCLERGSGDPDGDLQLALGLARDRGLLPESAREVHELEALFNAPAFEGGDH